MPDEVKIITNEINRVGRESRSFYDNILAELTSLNKVTERVTARLYDGVLGMLVIHPSTGVPENSIKNLNLVHALMTGLQPIQDKYRRVYGALARSYREEGLGLVADREERVGKMLHRLGVEDDRAKGSDGISEDTFEIVNAIHVANLRSINNMLEKWKGYVYDAFHSSIIKGLVPLDMRRMFYNVDGSIRVGSSLDQESVYIAMTSVTEQRTAYSRNEAKKNKMKYCWNFNPLDFRTKEECLAATMAGCISEGQMAQEHGFPPRNICRCDITFTREEWTGVNSSVNRAIDDRRQKFFIEMSQDPSSFQKSKWKVNGKWVYPKDDMQRLQGTKYYKDVSDKLDVLADPVPDFEVDFWDVPGTGGGGGGLGAELPQSVKSQMSQKQLTAIENKVPQTKASRAIAERAERELADALGAEHVIGKRPFDLFMDNEFIEVKTFISGRGQIRMKQSSKIKKLDFAKDYKVRPHTVLVDKRPNSPTFNEIFYRKGLGDFTTNTMTQVKDYDHLEKLIRKGARTPDLDVPAVKRLKASGSVSKAEAWAKKNIGISDVDYDEIGTDAADLFNKYIGGASEKLGIKPTKLTWDDAKFTGKNKRVFALADEDGVITFNRKFFMDEAQINKLIKQSFDIDHFGTDSRGHVLRHEMGHLEYFSKGGNEALANRKLTTTMKNRLKDIGPENLDKYVSKYARKSQGEFYAEMVAKELNGERLHPVAKKIKNDIERGLSKQVTKKVTTSPKGLATKAADFDVPDAGTPYASLSKLEKQHVNHITYTIKKGKPVKAGSKTHKIWESMDDNDKLTYIAKWEGQGLDIPDYLMKSDVGTFKTADDVLDILKAPPKVVKAPSASSEILDEIFNSPDVHKWYPDEVMFKQSFAPNLKSLIGEIKKAKANNYAGFGDEYASAIKAADKIIKKHGFDTGDLKVVAKSFDDKIADAVEAVGKKQAVNETMFTTKPYSQMTKLEKQHVNHITYTIKQGKPIGPGTKTHDIWNMLAVDKQQEFNEKWIKLGLDIPDHLKAGQYKKVVDVDLPKIKPKTTLPPKYKLTDADYTDVDNEWSSILSKNGNFADADLEGVGNIGGMHTKNFVTDADGEKWLFKPYRAEGWRAEADELAYKMGRLIDPDAVEVRVVKIGGQEGSLQKWVTDADSLSFSTSMSEGTVQQLQKEHVVDWLMGNHDAHSGQFIVKNGKVIGIDKGQAGKFLGKEKLSVNYSPNTSQFGAEEPIYNKLYKAAAQGQMKADPGEVLSVIKHVEGMSDIDYESTIRTYATRRAQATGESADDVIQMFMAKKHNLRSDFEQFFTELYDEPFKFVDVDDSIQAIGKGATHKEVMKEIEDARWLGKTVKGDREDIEDLSILNWMEVDTGGNDVMMSRFKLSDDARKKLEAKLQGSVPNGQLLAMDVRPGLPDDVFSDDITNALKTIFSHKEDYEFNQASLQKGAYWDADIAKLLKSPDPDVAAMAKKYKPYTDLIKGINDEAYDFDGAIIELKELGMFDKYISPMPKKVVPKNQPYTVDMRQVQYLEKDVIKGKVNVKTAKQSEMAGFGQNEYVVKFEDGTEISLKGDNFTLTHQGEVVVKTPSGGYGNLSEKLSQLGVDVTPPTPEYEEVLYLWQNAYSSGFEHDNQVLKIMGMSDDNKKLTAFRSWYSDQLGVEDITKTKGYNPKGYTNQWGDGYVFTDRLDNVADALADQGRTVFHSFDYGASVPKEVLLEEFLNKGGAVLSRAERIRAGQPMQLMGKGASASSDLNTGGADYFFTRLKKVSGRTKETNGLYMKPKVMNRTDAHWYTSDSFGKVGGRQSSSWKFSKKEIVDNAPFMIETTFKHGFNLFEDVQYWKVDVSEKASLIKRMVDHGFNEMPDGRSFDDFFITSNISLAPNKWK